MTYYIYSKHNLIVGDITSLDEAKSKGSDLIKRGYLDLYVTSFSEQGDGEMKFVQDITN
jgi:hypothetical protein